MPESRRRRRHIPVLAVLAATAAPAQAAADTPGEEAVSEIVVTSQRRERPLLEQTGNITRIDTATLVGVRHHHIHELMTRAAGVWITRASGQEHLTAIRSPVLTGPGSCGAFLFLEDGIPIRPAGFCNVNSLIELGTELADSIEVIRGPGNALYGSNALHGTLNALLPTPRSNPAPEVAVEAGSNDFYLVRASLPFDRDAGWLASAVVADDGGFRDNAGYRQGKLHVKGRWAAGGGDFVFGFSSSELEQQTAGYIPGRNAYQDPALNRANFDPEAFREAASQRAYGIWTRTRRGTTVDLRPYLRHSSMRFLQHFLPGKPLETNGHSSAGVLATVTFDGTSSSTIVGADFELADLFLEEVQAGPTEGSPFLVETRPRGRHYDYTVASTGIAAYVQTERDLGSHALVAAGLRAELLRYAYDNRMRVGSTRDDGTECGFGGCLYSRPADRDDHFFNIAPNFSVNVRLGPSTALYARIARGFRAPQATELYRLQNGQEVADLDSERIDSVEAGLHLRSEAMALDVSVFAAEKSGSVYRDSEGFNVSGGRSRHRGIETELDWKLSPCWSLAVDATFAHHTYDFDAVAAQGEMFVSGRDVDTAPRRLGSVEMSFAPGRGLEAALQWTGIGGYFLDAENRFRYPGHTVANLRVSRGLGRYVRLTFRINNLADRAIADRADYAFGNYRYFPGRGREVFAELRYVP